MLVSPMEIARRLGNRSALSGHHARHTHYENCVHPCGNFLKKSRGRVKDWGAFWAEQQEPQEKAQNEAKNQYSKPLCVHEDAELSEASEKVGTHVPPLVSSSGGIQWKSSVLGGTKSCIGRSTMQNTNSDNLAPCCRTREPRGSG